MFDDNDHGATPDESSARPSVPGLEMLDVVARGGHGTVYSALEPDHDRMVAVKVLDARFTDDATRRRFDRERTALGRLSDHPAIVPLIDSGFTEAGEPYLVLEFAPGGSLADRVKAGAMGVDEATAMVIGLASAIERAHMAGIVHRDIKPGNVMCSAYDDWMLTDFGIASLIDRTATGVVHASYAHTAPETFDGEGAEPTEDIYSLASVLATCLTGEEPFEMRDGEVAISAMRRVVTEPYPDLRRSGVADDLASLLEMALSKDPAQRPVSARAFAAALNNIREGHGLMPVTIRTGVELAADSTRLVDDAAVQALSAGADAKVDTVEFSVPRRRTRLVVVAALFIAALFGISSAIPSIGLTDSAEAVVVAVFDGGDDATDNDGDGPNGNEDGGNDNDGNGNDGNGPNGNGNDGNGPGNGNGNGGNGPGNGNGNGGNGPGNGNGNGGNGPGNGNGNGGNGNGNGGNGPGNGNRGGGNGPGGGGA